MRKILVVFAALALVACLSTSQQKEKKNPPTPGPTGITPQIVMTTTYTNATATPTNTPLTFSSLAGSTSYTLTCAIYFSGTTKVMQVDITGPPSPASLGYSFDHILSGALSGSQSNIATSFGTALGLANNTPTPNQKLSSIVTMGLVTGSTGGTITIQAAAPSGTITIYPGSFCRLQ